MGKVFGMLLIVFAIWVGLTIYTEGTDRAFGGLLSRFAPASAAGPAQPTQPPLERIRERAEAARDLGVDRIERQLSRSGER